ncbi:MAG: sigma-E processing peptidase SpoIIGA [bacterium]
MRYIVYGDIVFGVNFTVNLILLWAAGRFAGIRTGRLRLVLAALAGTVYLGLLFIPGAAWLTGPTGKIIFSAIMLAAAYYPFNIMQFCRLICYLYLSSAILAGTALGVFWLTRLSAPGWLRGPHLVSLDVQWWAMAAALAVLTLIGRYAWGFVRKTRWQDAFYVPLTVRFGDEEARVSALFDTGNDLSDPLSGHPVAVIEYNSVRNILPSEIRKIFEIGREEDLDWVAGILTASEWSNRFRVIPFSTIGRMKGMLLGFRPDRLEVEQHSRTAVIRDVIVCIYNRRLSGSGNYTALLNPAILPEALLE